MHSKLARVAAVIAVLLSACTASVAAEGPAQQVDAIFRPLVSAASPGFAVLVVKDGRIVFRRGYGAADPRTGAAITPQTNFRLASFTKQFTATAIMLLARDGRLRYDDPLTRSFPDFPAYGRTITVRQLLTHTSGLPDYEDIYLKPFAGTPEASIPQVLDADVLRIMQAQPAPAFPAGSKWQYSNSGYATLAMIVEKVSGKPFGAFLQERIFGPLGMRHTIAFENGKNQVERRAYGYRKEQGHWMFSDQSPTSAVLMAASTPRCRTWRAGTAHWPSTPCSAPPKCSLRSLPSRCLGARSMKKGSRCSTVLVGFSIPIADAPACTTTAKPAASAPPSSASSMSG